MPKRHIGWNVLMLTSLATIMYIWMATHYPLPGYELFFQPNATDDTLRPTVLSWAGRTIMVCALMSLVVSFLEVRILPTIAIRELMAKVLKAK